MGALIRYVGFGLLFFFWNAVSGQHHLEGEVVDQETKKPLALANIIVNNTPSLHTNTDSQGHFSIDTSTPIMEVTCSHVGYTKKKTRLKNIENPSTCFIELTPSMEQLEEISVQSLENPAKIIIRKVIANSNKNKPENRSSYQFQSYNKIVYDFVTNDKKDSIKIRRKLEGSHLFIMESVTRRTYHRPDEHEEVVLGTKVSGFKNPSFGPISSDFCPLSFYDDEIKCLDTKYKNPLSDKTFRSYKFVLEDTFPQGQDTVFLIHFKPLKHKNFNGLEGWFYIHSDQYAIQSVTAKPTESDKIDFKIQQEYRRIRPHVWFPSKNSFSLRTTHFPSTDKNITIAGVTYFDQILLESEVDQNKLWKGMDYMEEKATQKDSAFWKEARKIALSTSELKTYRKIDSLGAQKNFDRYLKWMEKGINNKIPLAFLDFDLTQLVQVNKFESARLGLGLSTNEKVFKNLVLGGFLGYGWKDQTTKYGFNFQCFPLQNHQFSTNFEYQNTLEEVGNSSIPKERTFFDFRQFISSRFDRKELEKITLNALVQQYVRVTLSLSHSNRTPLYTYCFLGNQGTALSNYENSQLEVSVRFAYKEHKRFFLNQMQTVPSVYPIVQLTYCKGFRNLLHSAFSFSKVEATMQQSIPIQNFGTTRYKLGLGYIDNSLPYGLLFTGEGGQDTQNLMLSKDVFQTMLPYEFLSTSYANLFVSHYFEGLLFKIKRFQPKISLHQNFSYGNLKMPTDHQYLDFKIKNKCFLESGLQIDDIVQVNSLNLFTIGVGMAGYYRYGAYHNPEFKDNIALKMALTFSLK